MDELQLIGKTIGKYEILSELGRGGMSIVYLARQQDLQRLVALKVLLPVFIHDPTYITRFRHEAQSAAHLEHPNIVPIHDVGEFTIAGQSSPIPYIAMRYIDGKTLHEVLEKQGAMGIAPAIELLSVIAGALDYAHQHNIVHRDLKPANIMIDRAGMIYLTDFGLARDITSSSVVTQIGSVLGTPDYMSPEQAQGLAQIGPPSDTYALGIVLYEMLTGKLPFSGDTPMSIVVARLLHEPMPPRDIRGDLPKAVEDVILKALSRNPTERYQSASALVQALRVAHGSQRSASQTVKLNDPPSLSLPPVIVPPVSGSSPSAGGSVPPVMLQRPNESSTPVVGGSSPPPSPSGSNAPVAGSGSLPPNQTPPNYAMTPDTNNRRRTCLIGSIGGLVALLLVCVGGYFFYQTTQTPASATAVAGNPTTAPTTSVAPTTIPTNASPITGAPTDASVTVVPQVPVETATLPPEQPAIRLSRATLLSIFKGTITNWNDPRIQADNPGRTFPDLAIQVIYRSDSSGTTRSLTEYFVQVDGEWASTIGAGYRLGEAGTQPWPTGTGSNGSSNLAKLVKTTPGAIGYVAPSYAIKEQIPLAILENSTGNWVSPESSTLREAANTRLDSLDDRLRGWIVNAPGANAYPISLYTWIIACPAGLSLDHAQALSDFLYWAISDPQAIAAARELGYEPPPPAVRTLATAQLLALRVDGQRIFTEPSSEGTFQPRPFANGIALSGAGATLPKPLYEALITIYQQVEPSVSISYDAQGSTQGREDLLQSGTIQFAGSEEAVVDDDVQITRAVCKPAPLHMPMAVSAVGIVYNLP